jgi:hypothetical protein
MGTSQTSVANVNFMQWLGLPPQGGYPAAMIAGSLDLNPRVRQPEARL